MVLEWRSLSKIGDSLGADYMRVTLEVRRGVAFGLSVFDSICVLAKKFCK